MAERKIILEGNYSSDLTPEHIRERVMRIIENSDRFQTKTPPVIELEPVGEDQIRFTAYEETMEKRENDSAEKKNTNEEIENEESRKKVKDAEQALKTANENIEKYGKEMANPNITRAMADLAANQYEEALEARVIAEKELERAKAVAYNPGVIKEEEQKVLSIQDSF